jgi:hypothetical protein
VLAATLFGVSLTTWAVLACTVFLSGVLGIGILIGKAIKAGRQGGYPVFEGATGERDVQRDLDDWLADDEPPFDFKVWKRPEARINRKVGT